MNRRNVLIAAAGLCLGVVGTTQAAVVYENLPDYFNAFFSDSGGNFPTQAIADDFNLGSNTSIGAVSVWGVYYPNNVQVDNFTIKIYSDGGGLPGTLLYSGAPASTNSVYTGVDAFGVGVYETSMTLASAFNAAGGTSYWLSVINNTNLGSDWGWVTSSDDFNGAFTLDSGGSWNQLGSSSAFRLYDVPAPSSLALVGLGGLCAMRRRR